MQDVREKIKNKVVEFEIDDMQRIKAIKGYCKARDLKAK